MSTRASTNPNGPASLSRHQHRPSFALILVIGAMAVCSVLLVAIQSAAFDDAGSSREAVARVRAYWAARSGIEQIIAKLEQAMSAGNTRGAYMLDDLASVAQGNLDGSVWEIAHDFDSRVRFGPMDAHAKLNINRVVMSPSAVEDLMELEGMTEDVVAAILDWIDADDTISQYGAELSAYQGFPSPYEPRNGPMRTIRELELIRNVSPETVRGEDWNLNNLLDPNEQDGDLSWPNDNRNNSLDAGWSQYLTTASVEPVYREDGGVRVYLPTATEAQVVAVVSGITPLQARVIIGYAQSPDAFITDFIGTTLRQVAQRLGDPAIQPQMVQNLSRDQLTQLLQRCTFDDPEAGPVPGRINLNTTSREILLLTPIFRGVAGEGAADLLLFARTQRGGGFDTILDLLDYIPAQQLQIVARYIDVRSSAYIVTSRGVDTATGHEVQIRATLQQTALPLPITEMIVR